MRIESMTRITVVLLADAETPEAMGRAANAFELVKEAKQDKDDVELILDGAATRWARELSKPDHKMRGLFESVRDKVAGVCEYCAGAFGVKEAVRTAGLPLIGEFDGHPSLAKRIAEGRQVVTF
jgi:hypothetical protein